MRSALAPRRREDAQRDSEAHGVLLSPRGVSSGRMIDLALCAADGAVMVHCVNNAVVSAVQTGEADLFRHLEGARRAAQRRATVSRDTVAAVRAAGAQTLVLGYDRDRDDAREIADTVRETVAAGVHVIVVCDRHRRPWRRLLVPYTYGAHDPEAFSLARRLALRTQGELMLLHVDEPEPDLVPMMVRRIDGCTVKVARGGDPIALAEAEVSAGYDVLVLGGGTPNPEHYFNMRQQRLLERSTASLVLVHAAEPAKSFDPLWFHGRQRSADAARPAAH